MKIFYVLIIAIGLILSACEAAQTQVLVETFTPTFDISKIVTIAPAEKTECPLVNDSLIPVFSLPTNKNSTVIMNKEVLKFLNQGGAVDAVTNRLASAEFASQHAIEDVTGDGLSELIFVDHGGIQQFYIFTCINGQYASHSPYASSDGQYYWTQILDIEDMNKDELPEIVIQRSGGSGSHCYYFLILEWDGKGFFNLIDRSPHVCTPSLRDAKLEDIDKNGNRELIIKYGPNYKTEIYEWNGKFFGLE